MQNMLTISNISKRYGSTWALKDFSLTLKKGQCLGILGPNGSGKTTALGIILGAIKATHGEYTWNLSERNEYGVGALLETPLFYTYLSGAQNLRQVCALRNIKQDDAAVNKALKQVGLKDAAHKKFEAYSLGMKQRLALASVLVGDPEVLILDEPTVAIDAQGIFEIRQIIRELKAQGMTMIIASHILEEVEKLCTDIAILKNGEKLQEGSISEMLADGHKVEIAAEDMNSLEDVVRECDFISDVKLMGKFYQCTLLEDKKSQDLNAFLSDKKIFLSHLSIKTKSLERHFIEQLIGH